MTKGRLIHQGRKFQVRGFPLTLSDGTEVERAVVVHPGAVVILATTTNNEIVFIKNRRFSLDEQVIELPAGSLEPNEDPDSCALRELREETGFSATSLKSLGWFYSAPGFCTEKLYAYVASNLENVGQKLEPDEDIDVLLLPEDVVRKMWRNGEIHDAKTLATLGLYFIGGD